MRGRNRNAKVVKKKYHGLCMICKQIFKNKYKEFCFHSALHSRNLVHCLEAHLDLL